MGKVFTVVEKFSAAKNPTAAPSEDLIYVGEYFAAVVDGATAKTETHYGGLTPGRAAAQKIVNVLDTLPRDTPILSAVSAFTEGVASLGCEGERPSAAVGVYSDYYGVVFSVGDVGWYEVASGRQSPRDNPLDEVASAIRANVTALLSDAGVPAEVLADTDPGRAAIMPLLRAQHQLRNTVGPWAYAAIDGTPVPASAVRVDPVQGEVVLFSDGYPRPFARRVLAEEYLAGVLAADPWCGGVNAGTKGLRPGMSSYDDRAWLLLST